MPICTCKYTLFPQIRVFVLFYSGRNSDKKIIRLSGIQSAHVDVLPVLPEVFCTLSNELNYFFCLA